MPGTSNICRYDTGYPVQALLEEYKERVRLTLHIPVQFRDIRSNRDGAALKAIKAKVLAGFRGWQGSYALSDGRILTISVTAREEKRGRRQRVFLADKGTFAGAELLCGKGTLGRKIRRGLKTPGFAYVGLRQEQWRFGKRHPILLRCDLAGERLRDVARHELGHVLGLGDAYRDALAGYPGMDEAVKACLAPYAGERGRYHLAMDDCSPVTEAEAEMVLCAIRENRIQLFQPKLGRGEISKVLAKRKMENAVGSCKSDGIGI